MIRVRGLITSIKSNLLTSRNAFPHKIEDSWDKEFNLTNPKINHLQRLLQTNEIRPYFIDKDIKELEKQDIYFYMSNKEKFHELPRHKKQELIKNENATCIFKFHLALELNTLKNEEVQKLLLHSFNTEIKTLSPSDTLFCLELICSFKNVKEEINYYEVERKFLKEEDPLLVLRCAYLLSQLEFKLEMMSNDFIQEKISMVENYELETILQIKHFARFYEIQLTPFCENRLRASFMEKRKNFKEDESQFVVELLQFYPESANLLKLQSMNAESYISYLDFFMPDEQSTLKASIPKPIDHPIPHSIVTSAEMFELFRIIKRRIALELDSHDYLMNNIKSYFTPDLNYVTAITRFLEKEDKMTPENQSLLERAILHKIIKLGDKAFEEFSIVSVFKILGYMSVNELGTITFWKKSLKFVTDAIEDPQNYKNLSSNEQKKFVVYLFQIFKNKPFPRELEDQIINLTLLSLTINTWSLKEILPLTISLKVNKIGDNQLWFGIEQRLKKIDIKHLDSVEERKTLKKIVHNFNLIAKGSYEFWSEVNKNLTKKQKAQILNTFKVPSTLAHTYLKV